MAREYISIGSTPCGEDCAQVGTPDYAQRAKVEGIAFINQLKRMFGEPPGEADIRLKSFPHDFGTYYEVVIYYNPNSETEVEYAYNIEGNTPEEWDDKALKELGFQAPSNEPHIKLHKTLRGGLFYTPFDKLPKKAQDILRHTKPEIENSRYTVYEDMAFIRNEVEVNGAYWEAEISLGSVDIRHSDYEFDDSQDKYVDDQGRVVDSDEYAEQLLDDLMSVIELENTDVYLEYVEDVPRRKKNPSKEKRVNFKTRK